MHGDPIIVISDLMKDANESTLALLHPSESEIASPAPLQGRKCGGGETSTLHTLQPYSTLHPPCSALHPPHSTLHPPHSTIHPPPSTLYRTTPPSTLHTLQPYSTLHPPYSTLHPPHSTIHPPPSTLYTPPSTPGSPALAGPRQGLSFRQPNWQGCMLE